MQGLLPGPGFELSDVELGAGVLRLQFHAKDTAGRF